MFGQVDGTAQVWTSGLMDKLSETFKSLARRVEAAVRSHQAQISVRLLVSKVILKKNIFGGGGGEVLFYMFVLVFGLVWFFNNAFYMFYRCMCTFCVSLFIYFFGGWGGGWVCVCVFVEIFWFFSIIVYVGFGWFFMLTLKKTHLLFYFFNSFI